MNNYQKYPINNQTNLKMNKIIEQQMKYGVQDITQDS